MEKKTRGFWTTAVLVIYIIGVVFSLIGVVTNKLTASVTPDLAISGGMIAYSIISSIILLAITIGIFMWKKVAIYALAIYKPVIFLISLLITDFNASAEQLVSSIPSLTVDGTVGIIIGVTVIFGLIGIAIAYLIVFSLLKKLKYNEAINDSMNV